MTPTESELISQETQQTTFQKEPTKHPITWPTLSQHSSLQSQPESSPKRTSMIAPQIGPHGIKKLQFLMSTGVLANTE